MDFFKRHIKEEGDSFSILHKQAKRELVSELEVAATVEQLYRELSKVYHSHASRETKLALRKEVFARELVPLREKYPNLKILREINNAEILNYKIYMTRLHLFRELYDKHNGDWRAFITDVIHIAEKIEARPLLDPFELVEDIL